MSRLFHVSERGDIARFDPRPVSASETRIDGAVVWAIDAAHLPNYLLPRACPRVTYVCDARASSEDRLRFFGRSTARRMIALDARWVTRWVSTPLVLYELPTATFECIDFDAGHYVSREAVAPLGVRVVHDAVAEMFAHDVEVRVVKDLLAIHEEVARSTLSFSSTRLRNLGGDT